MTMKKIFVLLTMMFTLAFSNICAAAGDGSALNKAQKVAEAFAAGATGDTAVTYTQAVAGLETQFKTKVSEQAFTELQKVVKEKLGRFQEAEFRSFERFSDGDRLIYIGKFSKEKVVAMVYVFDKNGKMTNFAFNPVQEQTAEKNKFNQR